MKISLIDIGGIEVPGKTSLIIYFSGCPIGCIDCHSKEFWNPQVGEEYCDNKFQMVLDTHSSLCDCVVFMGGDWNTKELIRFNKVAKDKKFKTCLYTGREYGYIKQKNIHKEFDYLKVGPYIEKLGGLDSKNTNQKFYKIGKLKTDISYKFTEEFKI